MTGLAVLAPPDFPALDLLRQSGVSFSFDDVNDAAAILVAPRSASQLRDVLPQARNLRWVHTLAAGVESLPFDALRERSIVVTNSRGLYGEALGEFVIGAMLWFAKGFRRLVDNQSRRRWEPFDVEWLQGKTAAVIGYGGIGSAIGRRAEVMGMRVVPVRRREGDLDEAIRAADYIVLSAPLTAMTRNLMNADRIARMSADAVLINISRGALVDEAAMIEALRARRIRGAALDVFATEPLPPHNPLWALDNVLLSPHSADHTSDAHERAMRFFLENLGRFDRGESLRNVVDLQFQY